MYCAVEGVASVMVNGSFLFEAAGCQAWRRHCPLTLPSSSPSWLHPPAEAMPTFHMHVQYKQHCTHTHIRTHTHGVEL